MSSNRLSVKRPGDLDLWPFDFGTGAECHPWHRFLPI